jgi:hypothetical protein
MNLLSFRKKNQSQSQNIPETIPKSPNKPIIRVSVLKGKGTLSGRDIQEIEAAFRTSKKDFVTMVVAKAYNMTEEEVMNLTVYQVFFLYSKVLVI